MLYGQLLTGVVLFGKVRHALASDKVPALRFRSYARLG